MNPYQLSHCPAWDRMRDRRRTLGQMSHLSRMGQDADATLGQDAAYPANPTQPYPTHLILLER